MVALGGRNAARVEVLGRRHGAAVYADTEAFRRHHPLDLVLIGSPPGPHAEQGIAAARHGLQVLVEEGRRSLVVVDALYRSARFREAVSLR